MFPSSLVDFSLNVHRIGSGALCWLWPVKHGCSLPSLLQGVPDEYWFLMIKGSLVTSSLSVVECCLSFLSSLISLLVEIIAGVFGLQFASAARECCLGFTSSGVVRYIHRAVYGHSPSSSAFLKSVLQVPIDLSARLFA